MFKQMPVLSWMPPVELGRMLLVGIKLEPAGRNPCMLPGRGVASTLLMIFTAPAI